MKAAAVAIGIALVLPSTASAVSRTEKAQDAKIKKLQRDIRVLAVRNRRVTDQFNFMMRCLRTYSLTEYGSNGGVKSFEGYSYKDSLGTIRLMSSMAPTAAIDDASAVPFLVMDCSRSTNPQARPWAKSLRYTALSPIGYKFG